MKTTFNGKQVEVTIELASSTCDSMISEGHYVETGVDLTDAELDALTDESGDMICEYAMENGGYRD